MSNSQGSAPVHPEKWSFKESCDSRISNHARNPKVTLFTSYFSIIHRIYCLKHFKVRDSLAWCARKTENENRHFSAEFWPRFERSQEMYSLHASTLFPSSKLHNLFGFLKIVWKSNFQTAWEAYVKKPRKRLAPEAAKIHWNFFGSDHTLFANSPAQWSFFLANTFRQQ